MRSSTILAGLSTIALAIAQDVTGQLGDATRNVDDPMGAVYQANIPVGKYGTVTGSITAQSAGDKGTDFAVNFVGLPTEGGPFGFHIHVAPVAADGNCNSTLAHLDPFIRGEIEPCNPARPETCQVGDLSGKYGKSNSTSHMATFTDPYVSLKDGMGAFFGNRSFVIHFANKSRIACANFDSIAGVATPPTGTLPPSGGNTGIATLVPAANSSSSGNSSSGPFNGVVTSTTFSIATPKPTASSSTGGTASPSPSTATAASAASSRDVASTLSLLFALAVGLWVL